MTGARAAGAAVEDDHAQPAFWTPVSETGWLAGGRGAYPHLALDRAKPGLIAVSAAGRRFVDEAVSYHESWVGMHRSHETVPTIPAWLVCDRAFVERYGLGRVPPGQSKLAKLIASGYLSRRIRSMRLAGKIKIDTAGLRDSCRAATTALRKPEIDEDFGKGSTDFDRHNCDPAHKPNPCVGPIVDRRRTTRWRFIRARSVPASG